jgi:hypothetical protein
VFGAPVQILSDNGQALIKSPEVLHFLKTNGIKQAYTICSHNSKANKIERIHKLLRESLLLVKETFKRESQFNLFYNVIYLLNQRPLTLSLHPHVKQICKEMGVDPGVVTPYSLQFGVPPPGNSMIPLEDTLEAEDKGAFRAKWEYIIKEHDRLLQQELDLKLTEFKGDTFEVGDLVLIVNEVRHKESIRFYNQIYEIIKIEKAKYYCAPLFKNPNTAGRLFEVSGNRLKKYNYSELFDCLPSKVRVLMGENLSPEQLKEQAKNNPDVLPSDLTDWRHYRLPNIINLRNRISPPDKSSEPALSIPETNILSDSTESSLSIPDSIPDNISEVSSLLNKSIVSGVRTTNKGLVKLATDKPFNVARSRIPPLQGQLSKPIQQRAITEEMLKKLRQDQLLRKKQKQEKRDKYVKIAKEAESKSSAKYASTPFGKFAPKPCFGDMSRIERPNYENLRDEGRVKTFSFETYKHKKPLTPDKYLTPGSVRHLQETPVTPREVKLAPSPSLLESEPAELNFDNLNDNSDINTDISQRTNEPSTISKDMLDKTNDSDSLGARSLIKRAMGEIVQELKKPIEDYIDKPNEPVLKRTGAEGNVAEEQPRPKSPKLNPKPKTPTRLVQNLSNIGRRLRSRSKLIKPLRFRDPNFIK